jgi:Na+/melibiose symporter-like transporter
LRPSSREIRGYALGAVPGGIGALAFSYLVFYYNQVLGIPASLIGLAAVLVSAFDAVTDPVAGAISDRTRTRWGRRHPFLFAMAIPSALTFYWIWAPPDGLSLTQMMVVLLTVHLVKRLIDTFYAVPYLALGAEISSDYEVRTRIVTMRNIYFHIGRAIAGALLLLWFLRPTPEYPNGQLNPAAYPRFGAVFALVTAAVLLYSAWRTRSWIGHLSEPSVAEHRGARDLLGEFRLVLRLRTFRALLFGSVARHIAWGVSDALGLYMATFFWGISTDVLFFWGIGMFGGLFIGLPFWERVAARFDRRPICMLGDGIYFVFFCLPYLFKVAGLWPDAGHVLYVPLYILTTGFIAHFGIAASSAMMGSMLGDVTDQDELAHGRRREGVIFGAESFTWKALTGLGPLVAGLVVDGVGLSESTDPAAVSAGTRTALGLAQGGVMAVCFALAVGFISRYDLDRRSHEEILESLRAAPTPASAEP